MKTALFSPCYLLGTDKSGSSRLERNIRWINFYIGIQKRIGFDDIWMIDNASPTELIKQFAGRMNITEPNVHIHHCQDHLSHGPRPLEYPYNWRALWFTRSLIKQGYKKIITIDSDCILLTNRMVSNFRDTNSGWETFWSEKYGFPLAEMHVLNEDAFPQFLEYTSKPWENKVGLLMENDMPFTKVRNDFIMDRYGEWRTPQTKGMDAYLQAPTNFPLSVEWSDEQF